ncbi:hypothetical protein HKD37_10G028679 [Glycine soja]
MKMNDNITLILHHGGRFTPRASDGKVEYIGGEFDVWEDMSADCLNAFILYDLVKACKKYSNIGECFWLIDKDLDFNHGLRSCTTDGDILHLVRDAFENENEINVYFHHEVDPILEGVPQMLYLECDPIPEVVENEDDLDDVPIAGHEEDVGAGEHRDAGEQRDADAGEQRDGGEQRDADVGEQRDGGGEERDVGDSEEEKEVDSDEWFTNFSCMMNEVEAEVETNGYHSEELNIPLVVMMKMRMLNQSSGVGEQKLELGMEFDTLDEFKSALREYSILMGREFKWKKNDKQRARAKCKKAFCDWEIYYAKNEVRNSFQIKTFKHNHNCCREVNNKQANRQWVYTHPVPPHKRVQKGKPKKNRRRSVDKDNVTGHRLKRKLADFTCGRCGQTNHNIRSCKNIGVPVRPKKYVAPPTSNEDDHLLSQDEQALNEAEEAAAHVQQDPVEINLSQPHLSQDSDMELMVPTTIVPPIARNKLTITRAKQRKVADKDDAV